MIYYTTKIILITYLFKLFFMTTVIAELICEIRIFKTTHNWLLSFQKGYLGKFIY